MLGYFGMAMSKEYSAAASNSWVVSYPMVGKGIQWLAGSAFSGLITIIGGISPVRGQPAFVLNDPSLQKLLLLINCEKKS